MEQQYTNWIDPDILAYDEKAAIGADLELEKEFKEFFLVGWLDSSYDDIRERWDPLLHDENPHGRLFAKTALWSIKRLREARVAVDKSKTSI